MEESTGPSSRSTRPHEPSTASDPSSPTIVVWAYCAETEAEAKEYAERYLTSYVESAYRHYEFFGTHFDNLASYSHYAERAARARESQSIEESNYLIGDHMWGEPDQRVERIKKLWAVPTATRSSSTPAMAACPSMPARRPCG